MPRTSSCWADEASTGVPRNMGSLCSMRDTSAAVPFAGSARGEAEHISQGHTHRHEHGHVQRRYTQSTETAGHTACHRQGDAFNITQRKESHKTQTQIDEYPPSLGLEEAGCHWYSAHKILSKFTSTYSFAGPSSVGTRPLFIHRLCLYPGPTLWAPCPLAGSAQCSPGNTWHSHLCSRHPHIHKSPWLAGAA